MTLFNDLLTEALRKDVAAKATSLFKHIKTNEGGWSSLGWEMEVTEDDEFIVRAMTPRGNVVLGSACFMDTYGDKLSVAWTEGCLATDAGKKMVKRAADAADKGAK